MKKKAYKIPVVWEMMGYIRVIASNEQEAIELAQKDAETCEVPKDGEYVEDSFQLDSDILMYIDDEDENDDCCLMSSDITYQDGYAFYDDLITTYGVTEGRAKARRYLDLPLPSKLEDVEEEKEFRDELVKAMWEGRR